LVKKWERKYLNNGIMKKLVHWLRSGNANI